MTRKYSAETVLQKKKDKNVANTTSEIESKHLSKCKIQNSDMENKSWAFGKKHWYFCYCFSSR